MNLLDSIFSAPAIITASVVLLVSIVCLLVLCVPRVRVKIATNVEVEVK